MELVINEENSGESNSSSNNTDIVSNINRALENPQIRGMVGAILSQNGIDPSQMGIDMPENQDTKQMDKQPEIPEESSEESNQNQINAQVVLNMVNEIAANSPMGENTTLGMVKQHIQENPEEINQALESQGLK